jgi:hypothetical protein
MKTLIKTVLLLTVFTFACEDNDTVFSVDPELSEYVDSFFQEASDRRSEIQKTNLTVTLEDIEDTTALGIDYSNNGQRYIHFNRQVFNRLNSAGDKITIEYELYKRLSVRYLDKSLYQVVQKMGVEYAVDTREDVLEELFLGK